MHSSSNAPEYILRVRLIVSDVGPADAHPRPAVTNPNRFNMNAVCWWMRQIVVHDDLGPADAHPENIRVNAMPALVCVAGRTHPIADHVAKKMERGDLRARFILHKCSAYSFEGFLNQVDVITALHLASHANRAGGVGHGVINARRVPS